MRIPRTAPQLAELTAMLPETAPEKLDLILRQGPTHESKYLHWDKVRHITPPANLTHREWWLGMKMARRAARQDLPFRSKRGDPFWFMPHGVVAQKLHEIDRRSGHVKTFEPQLRGKATKSRYILSSLAEEAITSSQLEGASTTRTIAKEMIRTGRKPTDPSERMILRNYHAMQAVGRMAKKRLTPAMILEIHQVLDPDERIRTDDDDVNVVQVSTGEILHQPPPASEVERGLEALCAFANDTADGAAFVHPVVRAVTLHFWIGYLHPFTDGNGRTARTLFYWSMLRQGYWLWEYVSISTILRRGPSQYARSYLYSETDGEDMTYFLMHQLAVMQRALTSLENYMTQKTRELQELGALLRPGSDLNHRQVELIRNAIRDPATIYTFRSQQNAHGVAYQTARTDILGLVELGLLEGETRKGRMFFSPTRDLETVVRDRFRSSE